MFAVPEYQQKQMLNENWFCFLIIIIMDVPQKIFEISSKGFEDNISQLFVKYKLKSFFYMQ